MEEASDDDEPIMKKSKTSGPSKAELKEWVAAYVQVVNVEAITVNEVSYMNGGYKTQSSNDIG